MTQLTLTPMARASHPETSRLAASSVEALNAKRRAVLDLLRCCGPYTHEQLCEAYQRHVNYHPKQSDSGIRSRCAELVRLGLVEAVDGEHGVTASGRKCNLWRAL